MLRSQSRYIGVFLTVVLMAVVIGALQYVYWAPAESGVGSGYDSGMFAYCGKVLAETHQLYAFCTDNKPPGIFIINAVASMLARNAFDWWPIWLAAFGAQLLTWTSVGVLATRAGARQDGWAIAMVGAVSAFVILDGAATVEMFSLPVQVLTAWTAYRIVRGDNELPWGAIAASGAGIGLQCMLRPNNTASGVLLLGAGVLLFVRGHRMAMVRMFAIAAVACIASMVLILAASGGMAAARGTLEFALSQGVSYSGAQRRSRIYAALSNVVWGSSLFALFATARYLGVRAEPTAERSEDVPGLGARAQSRVSSWIVLLGIWLLAEVGFSSVSARGYPHYSLMLLVPMALTLSALIGGRLDRVSAHDGAILPWAHPFGRAVAVTVACLIAVMPLIRESLHATAPDRQFRAYIRRVADTLATMGATTKGVFVWGGPPVLYLAIESASPARHLAPSTLATPGFSRPAYFDEMIACLAGSAPEFVLDFYDRTTVGIERGAGLVPTMVEVPEFSRLRAFVQRNYRRDDSAAGAGYAVWRRSVSPDEMATMSEVPARDCRPHAGSWRLHEAG